MVDLSINITGRLVLCIGSNLWVKFDREFLPVNALMKGYQKAYVYLSICKCMYYLLFLLVFLN